MAVRATLELIQDSEGSPARSYFVDDDNEPPNTVSLTEALAAVASVAPAVVDGASAYDIRREEISEYAWRITVVYGARILGPLRPLGVGEDRSRFNFSARPFWVQRAPVANSYAKSPIVAADIGGLIMTTANAFVRSIGRTISPPQPNLGRTVVVAASSISPAFVRTASQLVGSVNSVAVVSVSGTFAIGELFLCCVRGNHITNDDFQIDVEWSYKANVSNETWGDIEEVDYNGHDLPWALTGLFEDPAALMVVEKPYAVYVSQVHPYNDLNALGIIPP